ncbi:MAG: hypothetical protein MUF01_04420, partial [Bryobacterales bacterium]|nr:hypothetical protein [Bryobacterales bacterium]
LVAPISVRARPYCILHPQATAPEKIWPAAHFQSLAAWVERELGFEAVFIGAHSGELEPFSGFTCIAGSPLKQVMGLIAGAALFVGNDSGPAHVAAAFARAGVVLFGGSDPVVWAPWRCPQLRQIVHTPVADIPLATVTSTLAQTAAQQMGRSQGGAS